MASKITQTIRLVPLVAVSVALWVWILLNWREVLWFWFGVSIQWAFGMVSFALVIVVVLAWGGWGQHHGQAASPGPKHTG